VEGKYRKARKKRETSDKEEENGRQTGKGI